MQDSLRLLEINFFLNDREVRLPVRPDQTALELLREELRLTGTKESCSEGDCGACTVALGQLEDGRLVYRAVNACLLPAPRLHGRHLVTIEGLAAGPRLHLIQQHLLDHHATQCGYCTPGIAMSLFAHFSRRPEADEADLKQVLEGNLCRCTGYDSVRSAGLAVAETVWRRREDWRELILPAHAAGMEERLRGFDRPPVAMTAGNPEGRKLRGYYLPRSLPELFDVLATIGPGPRCRFINGGTDVMVALNVRRQFPENLVDLSGIDELDGISQGEGFLSLGANVTFTQAIEHPLVQKHHPVLVEALRTIGSEQVRNLGTLAGNVANASPIADGAVSLLGLGACLELVSPAGSRTLPLQEFYQAYKVTALAEHEIIRRIEVPLAGGFGSFAKFSKRSAVDIASVGSCFTCQVEQGTIRRCRIAVGGAAVYPKLARQCAEFLEGKPLAPALLDQAPPIAAAEFNTISDVRGDAHYRTTLIRNQIILHLTRLLGDGATSR